MGSGLGQVRTDIRCSWREVEGSFVSALYNPRWHYPVHISIQTQSGTHLQS